MRVLLKRTSDLDLAARGAVLAFREQIRNRMFAGASAIRLPAGAAAVLIDPMQGDDLTSVPRPSERGLDDRR